jgi:hypothetical protein
MVEHTAVRFYTGLILAEATVVVVVALLWRHTKRRLEGRPPRWIFSRLYPEAGLPPVSRPESTRGSPAEPQPSDQPETAPRPWRLGPEGPSAATMEPLVARVRALILKEVRVAREFRYSTYTGPVLAFRLSESPHDGFCSVVTNRDCVQLVFHRGAELPDGDGSLQGSTAHSRYLELRSPSDLHTTGARRFIREALAEAVRRRPPLGPHAVPRGRPAPSGQ